MFLTDTPQVKSFLGSVVQESLRDNLPYLAYIAAYCGVSYAMAYTLHYEISYSIYGSRYFPLLLIGLAAFIVVMLIGETIRYRSPGKALSVLWGHIFSAVIVRRVILACPMILVMPVFLSAFSSDKSAIPLIVPFHWDPLFSSVDRWIMGGVDPWRYVQALGPWATFLIDKAYNAWAVLAYAFIFIVVCSERSAFRSRVLMSFLMIWSLIGNLAATIFSSAGPCYFGLLYPGLENPYADLMQGLQDLNTHLPLMALSVQSMLWDLYASSQNGFGGGISAMPSMHVSMSCLMALAGWRFSGVIRIGSSMFLAIILVGSVLLGWHYLIDGLVSIVLTIGIWMFAGRMFSDRLSQPVGIVGQRPEEETL